MEKYNNISKDIEKKHQQKMNKIYDFITSDKSINEFVKIYDDSFANTYLDFRKFFIQNYKRIFISNVYFLHVLTKRGIKRYVKNKIELNPGFEFKKKSEKSLKRSFVKAVKKWILFQEEEKNISDTLYSFAKLNTKGKAKDLQVFLEKWNMNRSHYYNARTGFLKNGLVIEKVIKKEVKKKAFDFAYTFTDPAVRKKQNEKIHLEKKRSKTIINEFIKSYFVGRVKGIETIKAFKVLNIPLDASIKEIKELLNNK